MKITNKYGLPQAFVTMAESDYQYKDKRYSVSSLLKGTREIILERRHHDKIEQDVSDMIWLLFGTAVHSILEQHEEADHELAEEYLILDLENGYKLSGRFDLYNAKTKTVTDYKTCSVWKMIYKDFEDWRTQLLIYAYMLKSIGFEVETGEIIAMMKDHSKSKAKYDHNYPQLPVDRIKFSFSDKDFEEIEVFIKERFKEIAKAEGMADDELPLCTPEQRFNSGDKFAVMKKNRKRALRVLDSMEEAETYLANNGGDFIETRPGEDKKCNDYCRVNKFCSYYNKVEVK